MHKNPVWIPPDDKSIKLLKATVELGMPMGVMGAVLAAFPRDPPIPIDVLRYTFGPLVFHNNGHHDGLGWHTQDTLSRWRPRVSIERLEILCGERPDIVSPAEIWLVMYNATMEAPLYHDITEIYLWASRRAYLAAGHQKPALWDSNQMQVPTDEQIFDGNLSHEYRLLCQAIIRKVVANSQIRSHRGKRAVV